MDAPRRPEPTYTVEQDTTSVVGVTEGPEVVGPDGPLEARRVLVGLPRRLSSPRTRTLLPNPQQPPPQSSRSATEDRGLGVGGVPRQTLTVPPADDGLRPLQNPSCSTRTRTGGHGVREVSVSPWGPWGSPKT